MHVSIRTFTSILSYMRCISDQNYICVFSINFYNFSFGLSRVRTICLFLYQSGIFHISLFNSPHILDLVGLDILYPFGAPHRYQMQCECRTIFISYNHGKYLDFLSDYLRVSLRFCQYVINFSLNSSRYLRSFQLYRLLSDYSFRCKFLIKTFFCFFLDIIVLNFPYIHIQITYPGWARYSLSLFSLFIDIKRNVNVERYLFLIIMENI